MEPSGTVRARLQAPIVRPEPVSQVWPAGESLIGVWTLQSFSCEDLTIL
jgi:hypothetical protein